MTVFTLGWVVCFSLEKFRYKRNPIFWNDGPGLWLWILVGAIVADIVLRIIFA